jgi:hypothetical protein
MTRTPDEQEQALAQDQTHEPPAATQQAVENILAPGQELALARLSSLDARNHQDLADLLLAYPELREAILSHATQHFGNAMVSRALALVTAHAAQAAKQDDNADVADFIQKEANTQNDAATVDSFIEQETNTQNDAATVDAFIEQETNTQRDAATVDAFIEQETNTQNDAPAVDAFIETEVNTLHDAANVDAFIDKEGQKSTDVVEPVALDAKEKEVVAAVDTMTTNDEELLAATLTEQPELRGPIVMEATEKLGADTVAQAIEVQHEQPPQEQEVEVQQEAPAVAQAEIEQAVEEPATAQKPQDEWARNAASYNERHAAFVEEFHNLTGGTYRLPDGTVDPAQVMAWQMENNLQADGKIGPQTVAAARAGAKKPTSSDAAVIAPAAVEEQQEEEQPPPV